MRPILACWPESTTQLGADRHRWGNWHPAALPGGALRSLRFRTDDFEIRPLVFYSVGTLESNRRPPGGSGTFCVPKAVSVWIADLTKVKADRRGDFDSADRRGGSASARSRTWPKIPALHCKMPID